VQEALLGNYNGIAVPPPTAQEHLTSLSRWVLLRAAAEIEPENRSAKCFRYLAYHSASVFVKKTGDRAFYRGLVICGSPWSCPVCAARIAEVRTKEIEHAISTWLGQGGVVEMITLTMPHSREDSLQTVLDTFFKSRLHFYNRKTMRRIRKASGYIGSIRALEVTLGVNGWHVHSHELLFLEKPLERSKELLEAWKRAVVDSGWRSPNGHGLSIENVWSSEAYVAKYGRQQKWGAGKELAKSRSKRGRAGAMVPWDFLEAYHRGIEPVTNAKRWREYIEVFKGHHQIEWSKGLKARFGVKEVTDAQAAEFKNVESIILGRLSLAQWREVYRTENRGQLLRAAETGGWAAVVELVAQLTGEQYVTGVPF
jgi:hypothetical protein